VVADARSGLIWRRLLSPETGGPARRFLDARGGALHGRDKRSVRRSRWRARAGGASATTYGARRERRSAWVVQRMERL
jgi:hypothetical protein